MKKIARLMAPIAAVAVLVAGPASNANAVVVLAVPGSFQTTYATPVTVAPQGGPLFFVNTDLQPHNVVAQNKYLPKSLVKKAPWCKQYSAKKCPLFWSAVVSDNETQVNLTYAPAGTYTFYCEIHPKMTATLVILPTGGAPQGTAFGGS
jgi:plastocyanin